ncbi:MAG: T9SS type A sorting domain-containing protein [Taibaiella sp.]|nr:T9SS type A sorting domain-containing protein [Taibaiella sp.]
MKRMKLLFTLALPVLLIESAQAQLSRLISQAHWSNTGAVFVAVDSTDYKYNSNTRGGDLKRTLKYDEGTTMLATDTSFINSSQVLQTFYTSTDGAGGYADNIKYKATRVWNLFSGTWVNSNNYYYTYNSDGTMRTMIYQTWGGSSWINVSQNIYTYSGGLQSDKYLTWNGATFVLASQKNYINDAGRVTDQTDVTIVSGTPTYTQSYHYDYDSAGRTTTASYNVYNGTSFVPNNQYAYTYDGTGNRLTSTYSLYNTTTGAWDNNTLKIYSDFTAGHNPKTEINQKWDTTGGGSWYNVMQFTNTYNSQEQLTSMMGISWNTAGFWQYRSGDPMAMYHYGTYFPAAVADVNTANGVVNIFPVPAQNTINISLNWNEAQAFSVAIFDINGRTVQQWNVPTTSQYTTTINAENIPAGNYIVKIGGAKGQVTKQIVIVH